MAPYRFDDIYKKVPAEQKAQLKAFREKNPVKHIETSNTRWEYFSYGQGKKNLVLLVGGVRFGDAWFQLMMALENEYRIIAPTYPGLVTMSDLVQDLEFILKNEKIARAHVLGTSFGGWLAQCFVRVYPEKVDKLILSHTSVPGAIPTRLIAFALKLAAIFPTRMLQLSARTNMLKIMSLTDSNREFWKAFWEEKIHTHLLNQTREEALSLQMASLDYSRNYSFSPDDLTQWLGQIYIIQSENDKAIRAKARKALRELYPQAEVYTFQDAGHTPGYSKPDEYYKVLKNFLDK